MAGARIFVTGATGLVGGLLCERLAADGAEVVALSRRAGARVGAARLVVGDVTQPGAWQDEIDGAAAVVHLAGESIAASRWTSRVKQAIRASRIEGTRNVARAITRAAVRPGVLVCASAAGLYGPRGEERLDESSPPGDGFLARLCVDWEREARGAESPATRVVSLRFGMVLSRRGGALSRMLPVFRAGAGGPIGPAHRYTPWIHERDAAGLACFAVQDAGRALSGPLNAVAPECVRMGDFARTLGSVLGRPALIPVPEIALRVLLGEAADAVVPGQHVVPRAARDAGYGFVHPELRGALEDLLA